MACRGSPGFTAITNHLEGLDTSIVMEIPRPLAGFLRRTFDNPPILHHLTPLCRYFHGKGRLGNSGRMYAHFHKGQVDIISFSRSTVALANSYRYRDPMDAIYYIMACRNMAGLDPMADELFLCGDTAVREETTPQLREYLAYVMPVIFPSAVFKTGKTHFQHLFTLQYSHYANNPRKIRTSALRRPHKHIGKANHRLRPREYIQRNGKHR